MTKAELRSVIKNRLKRVDKTRKYTNNQIDFETARIITEYFNQVYKDNPMDLDLYTTEYTISSFQTNATTGVKYVNYASGKKPLNLKGKRVGVRNVNAKSTLGMTFFPYTERELQYFYGSELDNIMLSTGTSTRVGYRVLSDRVEFYKLPSAIESEGVVMSIIYDYYTLADTDDVNLPGGQDASIIDDVVQRLIVTPPIDLENDNNDDPNS